MKNVTTVIKFNMKLLHIALVWLSVILYDVENSCVEKNYGYSGYDLKTHLDVASWEMCESLCKSMAGCKAWTWITQLFRRINDRKKCYLKYSSSGREPYEGKISGTAYCERTDMNSSIKELKRRLSDYEMEIDEMRHQISQLRNDSKMKIDGLQNQVQRLDGKVITSKTAQASLKNYIDQLKMFIQMDDERFLPIKLKFKDILKLAGVIDQVTPAAPLLAKLIDQFEFFKNAYKDKWNIAYDDVLRLMVTEDFREGTPPPVLKKIDALYKLFEKNYQTKWGILFKDVIRLSVKTDLHFGSTPLVLRKIEHMYQLFITKYNPHWHIGFPDVVKLTKDVTFAEDATDIPALKKIGEYYVDGFQDIWGDSFGEFLHLILAMDEPRRKELVNKLAVLARDTKLKFLPAKFEYKDNELSISGYVEIRIEGRWGTIWNKNGRFGDKEAEIVCKYSGYSNGRYGIYGKGGVDRSNMPQLVELLRCFPDAKVIDECQLKLVRFHIKAPNKLNLPPLWDHKDDVSVLCIL